MKKINKILIMVIAIVLMTLLGINYSYAYDINLNINSHISLPFRIFSDGSGRMSVISENKDYKLYWQVIEISNSDCAPSKG